MSVRVRKVLWWLLLIFALYAVFRSPEQAADVTRAAFDGISAAISAIGRFFDALLAG